MLFLLCLPFVLCVLFVLFVLFVLCVSVCVCVCVSVVMYHVCNGRSSAEEWESECVEVCVRCE